MGKLQNNQAMPAAEAKKAYILYATNINVEHLKCTFNGDIGRMYDVHGDLKSVKSKFCVTFHSMTMHTTDGKYKMWIYRGRGEKYLHDTFEIEEGTKEEALRVMIERATGKDANGNKIEITN